MSKPLLDFTFAFIGQFANTRACWSATASIPCDRQISRTVLLINYVLIGFSHTNSMFNMQVHGQRQWLSVRPSVCVFMCIVAVSFSHTLCATLTPLTHMYLCLLCFSTRQKQLNTLFSRLTAARWCNYTCAKMHLLHFMHIYGLFSRV